MATYLNDIIVDEKFMNLVKEALGYPLVDLDVIEDLFPTEYIRENVIGLSAEEFFSYFPFVQTISINVNGTSEVTVDAPENTLGILHYAFVNQSDASMSNLNSGNPFHTSAITTISSSRSNYGTPFNYNSYQYSSYQQKFYQDALTNSQKAYYAIFDEINNKISAKSSLSGVICVDVGMYDTDINKIPKNLRFKFLDLCRANLK